MREKRGGWWSVAVIVPALALLLYIGSYFTLTRKTFLISGTSIFWTRKCPYRWMAFLYKPLAAVEEAVTGDEITIR